MAINLILLKKNNFTTTSKSKYLIITLRIFWKGSPWYFARYLSLTVMLFQSTSGKCSTGLAQFIVTPNSSLTLSIIGLNSLSSWIMVMLNTSELYLWRVLSRYLKNTSSLRVVMWIIDMYFTCLSIVTINVIQFI